MDSNILSAEQTKADVLGAQILADPVGRFLKDLLSSLIAFYPEHLEKLEYFEDEGLMYEHYFCTLGRECDNIMHQMANRRSQYPVLTVSAQRNQKGNSTHIEVTSPNFIVVQQRVNPEFKKKRDFDERLESSFSYPLFPEELLQAAKEGSRILLKLEHGFDGTIGKLGFAYAFAFPEGAPKVAVDLLELFGLKTTHVPIEVENTDVAPAIILKEINTAIAQPQRRTG